ncbi:bifunctional phosphoribosylaminoimidazolecarboxamide formyltransferase/IMP cyclohydrolase [Shouchella clausii]|uniref:bifunctional phosphoribosylaminoimidazolecarboxamide formyltransferase/IMP cyclohydrolase n=1 Tax=Shouchella clausii TaxID=79880 RepID=UPI000B97C494|nr:bifunctional phosphoribosylaminoimidazolecarboxamide formyltransferase/IMP cyclohydrolase [Shouchella clausii]PAD43879.1 bifunctional phosphoribosylaminoimidazolecarboxamide formyltransferase/IMP cyclohydrolase [Bacillus sp. 7520-S]AST94628.1 bifunctional phosphoribosylaminoimidazolecarboxamide formyltransferase/IMP cyclohydrolase [Shouchella clausii]MBU8597015.1 bifunctional phosphoribosylaminoimidazolecarboxamide formyltransferase/IMP cyclohydrolase [Shouchella clausii]MCY1104473.1 bifunct
MTKRALVSVSNKTGLIPFVKGLAEAGVEILSTGGGTKRALEEAGIAVVNVSDVTGFPEILDGRVKTLHPNIHGGLLAMRTNDEHIKQIEKLGIEPIDYVVVNLYPFAETIANPEASFADAIENIDIGGPSMLRSAAKNHADVTVVVDPADYDAVLASLNASKEEQLALRQKLAAKVFRHTAAYDAMIGSYLTDAVGEENPESLTVTYTHKQTLRYGENPHQKAAFYESRTSSPSSIAQAKQLHGKELSYNNINDANAALEIVKEFSEPAAVAVKHMNPCGVGTGATVGEAYTRAYEADPKSIFGGIVALNREVDRETAEKMAAIFLEVILAPSFSEEAKAILQQKKNIRLLEVAVTKGELEKKLASVHGGLLIQEEDHLGFDDGDIRIPTKREPTEEEWTALKLGWKVVKHVKSNAIVLTNGEMTVGIGAGQMNRVGAAAIAIEQAGERAQGAALASDAFFPYGDTVEAAAKAGITAIIQPGGSVRDNESIEKADEYGIAMVFTGVRHFKH